MARWDDVANCHGSSGGCPRPSVASVSGMRPMGEGKTGWDGEGRGPAGRETDTNAHIRENKRPPELAALISLSAWQFDRDMRRSTDHD
jgi:hypothetical protein